MTYRTKEDNKSVLRRILNDFTTRTHGSALELVDCLYGMYIVECFEYSDDVNFFNTMGYLEKVVVPHKIEVYRAGKKMIAHPNFPRSFIVDFMDNIWLHDLSKFSAAEAIPYAFTDFKSGNKHHNFEYAWNHHKQSNAHHPEHWLSVDRSGKVKALDMPEIYVLEMIADWVGAGISYGSTIDEWLPANINTFLFSDATAILVAKNLALVGIDAKVENGKIVSIVENKKILPQ